MHSTPSSNINIRLIDMMFLDEVFEMGSGYVLNFSDRTFAIFFATELNIDIDSPEYAKNGSSKGKRLKCFFQSVDKSVVVRALEALWEYREALRVSSKKSDTVENAHGRLLTLINRLKGVVDDNSLTRKQPVVAFDRPKLSQLKKELISISQLTPQARGYALEKFLKQLFDVYGLAAIDPFKLKGEQIDGSFQLDNETYLVEAKWQDQKTGVADLHTFHGKIEQKAAWTRGLFFSNSGFTDDGLIAFGKGKRVVCMDSYDLHETLQNEIPLNVVLEKKVRRAAETGLPFVSVRDLFPN